MGTWQVYSALQELARIKFADIVIDTEIMLLSTGDPSRLRLTFLILHSLTFICLPQGGIRTIGIAVSSQVISTAMTTLRIAHGYE